MALTHGAHAGATVGQDSVSSAVRSFSAGHGADAVLVFASSENNEAIELAAELARERGRIVVPGLVGLDLPRKMFYEKELQLVVSRAWGPGMYDPDYEAGQVDYPQSLVRWTAQRNMAQVIRLLNEGRVSVDHLITHRYHIDEAVSAYNMILKGDEPTMGVVLQYPEQPDLGHVVRFRDAPATVPEHRHGVLLDAQGKDLAPRDPVRIGLIGAGLFAKGTLLPIIGKVPGAAFHGVAASTGVSAEHVARKYDFDYCTTDAERIIADADVDLVMILTRHGSHAALVSQALAAGKHVFVEKPLALDPQQLRQVTRAYEGSPGQLMVGFNRRFAPITAFTLAHLTRVAEPLVVNVRVNAGHIPRELWVHDPLEGGGNLVGEVCHFVDLIQALTGAFPITIYARSVQAGSEAVVAEDNVAITLAMDDGSVGTIIYTTLGDKAHQREWVEVFGGGAVGVIDNFRVTTWSHGGRRERFGSARSGVDRGHRTEMETLVTSLRRGEPFPVSIDSYLATTRATFAALESLRCGMPVELR
jgi:predicted dehydrogenase